MADKPNWKLKQSGPINPDDVAKIACALKSLSVYAAGVIEEDENPEELQKLVDEGLAAIDRVFEL